MLKKDSIKFTKLECFYVLESLEVTDGLSKNLPRQNINEITQ